MQYEAVKMETKVDTILLMGSSRGDDVGDGSGIRVGDVRQKEWCVFGSPLATESGQTHLSLRLNRVEVFASKKLYSSLSPKARRTC